MEYTRISSDSEHSEHIQSMHNYMGSESGEKVGLFWYSPKDEELFGVNSVNASDLRFDMNGRKTISKLHRDIWQRQKQRDKAKGKVSIWSGDYTMIPRGRVWQRQEDEKFYVTIGSWIDKYPEAKDLILDEFDLPNDVEFIIDRHWEIGHGWSE